MNSPTNTVYIDESLYAFIIKRFANLLIDTTFIFISFFLVKGIILLLYTVGFDSPYIWFKQAERIEKVLLLVFIWFAYYSVTEIIFSRTIAKFITGTKVVMYDGSKPDAVTILLRTACRAIPIEAFSFLGSAVRGWHDTLSKTYVVDIKGYNQMIKKKQSFGDIEQEKITEFNNY